MRRKEPANKVPSSLMLTCPRCVAATARVFPIEQLQDDYLRTRVLRPRGDYVVILLILTNANKTCM